MRSSINHSATWKSKVFTGIRTFASDAPASSKHRKERGLGSYKFVDRARIRVQGGSGGKGCVSHHHVGAYKKIPNGGHGGHGGSVIIVADDGLQTLNMSKHHFSGEKGNNGSSQEKHGRNGKNYVLRVPCGVVVRRILEWNERWDEKEGRVMMIDGNDNRDDYYDDDDYYTDEDSQDVEEEGLPSEDFEAGSNVENQKEDVDWGEEDDGIRERYNIVLADLNVAGSFVEVAHGGRGGTGNCTVRGRDKNDSKYAQKAGLRARSNPGEMSFLELELKLIADLGFVGFPNAGKSSLLASMSRASPEIAPYPFTTLQPLVGTIEYRDGFRVLAADVPGLVKGASSGRGRGFDFLRHLERTKALLYMVDAAGVDGRCPVEDLKILFNEIAEFGDGDMLKRPSLVVANKLDLLREEDGNNILLELGIALEEAGLQCKDVIGISALSGHGLSHLSKEMRAVVEAGEYSRVISE